MLGGGYSAEGVVVYCPADEAGFFDFERRCAMTEKSLIMDEAAIHRAMARITHEIIERNRGAENICLLGVKRRGVPLSEMLADNIEKFEGVRVPLGSLDITLHRDDISEEERRCAEVQCEIPGDITSKTVIIVDDVMYTGRTARAAIEAVFSHARPKELQFAVLIDRGHRELPIRADYVGKNVPTAKTELISVKIMQYDGENGVYICDL